MSRFGPFIDDAIEKVSSLLGKRPIIRDIRFLSKKAFDALAEKKNLDYSTKAFYQLSGVMYLMENKFRPYLAHEIVHAVDNALNGRNKLFFGFDVPEWFNEDVVEFAALLSGVKPVDAKDAGFSNVIVPLMGMTDKDFVFQYFRKDPLKRGEFIVKSTISNVGRQLIARTWKISESKVTDALRDRIFDYEQKGLNKLLSEHIKAKRKRTAGTLLITAINKVRYPLVVYPNGKETVIFKTRHAEGKEFLIVPKAFVVKIRKDKVLREQIIEEAETGPKVLKEIPFAHVIALHKRTAYLDFIHVPSKLRGKGYGRDMIFGLVFFMRRRGLKRMTLQDDNPTFWRAVAKKFAGMFRTKFSEEILGYRDSYTELILR